jgi:hypothetical protein
VVCPALNIELLTPPGPGIGPLVDAEPLTSSSARSVR